MLTIDMGKDKKQKKTSIPTTLLHYTSWEAFLGIFDNSLKSNSYDLTLHASQVYAMNDRIEEKFILDEFFTESDVMTKIREKVKSVKDKEGETYIVSFSRSTIVRSNRISPWLMYASNGRGVCLHFDYKKIEEIIGENKNMRICECKYCDKDTIREKAKELRYQIKEQRDAQNEKALIKELLFTASTYKPKCWQEEKEYRIIQINKNPKYKVGRLGLVSYQEINIPLDALKTITIGPMANKRIVRHSLQLLHERLYDDVKKGFKIEVSKLQIQ